MIVSVVHIGSESLPGSQRQGALQQGVLTQEASAGPDQAVQQWHTILSRLLDVVIKLPIRVHRSEATRRFKLDLAIHRGLRSVKLSPLLRPAGGPSTVTPHADPN